MGAIQEPPPDSMKFSSTNYQNEGEKERVNPYGRRKTERQKNKSYREPIQPVGVGTKEQQGHLNKA
jgi:hypothetical protein